MRSKQIIVILLPCFVLAGAGFFVARRGSTRDATAGATSFSNVNKLIIDDLVIGTGAVAVDGKIIVLHYSGLLTDGKQFDSSWDDGQPYFFRMGKDHVIDGWQKGLVGMKVGGKRRLHIPPDMAYGAKGVPPKIPPNATLIFDIELMEVR